jgi:EmrB/QacA subfamily drug resistance transporter
VAETTPSGAPATFSRHDKIILSLVCVAQFMVVLDVSIVNVALPSIGRSLHYSATGLQWVVNAYVLAFAGFLLLGGRAADIFGRRRIFIFGAVLFCVASLAGGLATTSGVLTASRVAQGLGGAFLSPATLTIIVTSFSGPRLPKALGAWGAVSGAGGAAGALLGGILTAELSWRWVLFVNIPIGIFVVIVAFTSLTEISRRSDGSKLDVAGAVLATAGLTAVIYAIVGTDVHPWASGTTLLWLGSGVVLLALFALVETQIASSPLIPFSFFKSRATATTNVVMFLVGASSFAMWYFLTLYYQEVLGWGPLKTGFAFAPQAVAIIAGAQISTRLMPKVGAWSVIIFGTSAATVGFFFLGHLSPTSSYFGYIIWPACLLTFALGTVFSPLAAAATSHVNHQQAGLASGLLNSSRQVGGSLGLAVLATIAVGATKWALPGFNPNFEGAPTSAELQALTHGYNQAFMWGAAISLVSVVAALLIPRDVAKAATRAPAPAPAEPVT